MPVTIERAQPADFLQVAALDRIAWLHTGEAFIPDGEHVWRVWCEFATVLVARLSDQSRTPESDDVAGALLYFPTHGDELFLHKIMVHPDYRGKGIGTSLMNEAIRMADGPLLLTVDPANAAAIQLYRNFGFEIDRHIEGYYRPHEHRYLMICRPK